MKGEREGDKGGEWRLVPEAEEGGRGGDGDENEVGADNGNERRRRAKCYEQQTHAQTHKAHAGWAGQQAGQLPLPTTLSKPTNLACRQGWLVLPVSSECSGRPGGV